MDIKRTNGYYQCTIVAILKCILMNIYRWPLSRSNQFSFFMIALVITICPLNVHVMFYFLNLDTQLRYWRNVSLPTSTDHDYLHYFTLKEHFFSYNIYIYLTTCQRHTEPQARLFGKRVHLATFDQCGVNIHIIGRLPLT
jgi:cellulose synthase/poly-beta-1,6-N-acetylglucosamine synthase-like glycosyltransferase